MVETLDGIGLAPLANILAPAPHHAVIGMGLKEGHLSGKAFGLADVVGIHSRDQGRAGFLDKLVEAGDQAAVLANDRTDPGVACGMGRHDLTGAIGGAVIENQQFEITKSLAEHALDGFIEKLLAIIDAHRD